ncbi:MAG: RagB/SusD family nutrient uptake outer membrane protein [Prevotellaceae bacterium]|nr:RagB/SusD family nutrient uptake outer membrane protein [Prevotellaceae bacterium]
MKTKKTFFSTHLLIAVIAAIAVSLNSCDGFLENEPSNYIVGSTLTEENLPMLTAPLYNRAWYGFNSNFYFGLGDGMAYNLNAPYSDYIYPFSDLSITGLTGPLVSAWTSLYTVAGRATGVVKTIEESRAAQEVKNRHIAEARYMRGTAYWYLASLWGDAIIVDNEQALIENPIVNTNPKKDVYEYAIRDLEFAAKYLPETAGQAGHVTRYSAFGMLSRLYLDYSGFAASKYGENPNCGTRDAAYLNLAKKAAEKVLNSGAYKLMDNYADLFKIENNNNAESLFALQWVPGLNSSTGYGLINTHQAYFAFGSAVTGDDAAWGGGGTGCPYDMIKEYEPNDTIRRKATWMGNGDHYPEINKANGGLTYNEATFSAAPRWLSVKKGVTGSNKDNPAIGRMNSAYDNYMLRLAEVYLNYAEAALGNSASTSDEAAMEYFNRVRVRAGLSAKTSITWDDLRHERRIEFCLEGRYWYDLVARAYYRQQEVINYLNAQNRGTVPPYLFDAPNNLRIDPERDAGTRAVGTATPAIFKLPYPESELLQNPKLGEKPVPFEFTENRITDLF